MPINILMPALSPTMTEGNLAKWHKKAGDTVSAGDVIAEIETDKATMEVEAVDEGTLGKILVAEGTQGVKVNDIIAILLEEGEDASALAKVTANTNAAQPAATSAPQATAQKQPAPAPIASTGNRVRVSPLAKRLATEKGLDLTTITGTGPYGRIVKVDVLNAKPQAAKPTQVALPALDGMPNTRTETHSTMRKVIAKRLTESKQLVPHFYLNIDVELDGLLALRKQINDRGKGAKLSVNDFVIKASALALKEVPAANASWTDNAAIYYDRADISVAVAIDGGLITPIIRGACGKSLNTISLEMKDLAERARANKLKPEEFQGGTFSLSNLGMFGIKHFNAIINPPQACILAVGAGEQRPMVKNSQLGIATVMTCTLSVDHRIVDGAVGAEYLAAFKRLIEDPLSLILG